METQPPVIDIPSVRRSWWMLPVMAVIALVVLVYAVFDPAQHVLFPKCTFHSLTGLDCPGCGGQRALHQLLRGNLADAFRYNALLVSLIPFGLWTLIRTGIRFATGHSLPSPLSHPAWPWALAGLIIVFGIGRNLPWGGLLR